MALAAPPPPLTTIYNNASPPSTSSTTSAIIVTIIVASAVIASASIYLLIRFLSRHCNRSDDVVSIDRNDNEQGTHHHHVICFDSNSSGNGVDLLPMFTFSSLTGKIAGGDCAVCLSKFEAVDQLRLLPLCCHAFHVECIDAWLKANQTCPLCRSSVNPSEGDVMNKISSITGAIDGNRSNSFRIEIGSISRRRAPSDSGRRSYSVGSYEYVLDDGYEIPVESTHRRGISDCTSVDKDSTTPGDNLAAEVAAGGSGRLNWLREYVDRVSVSLSSRSQSFRGSGRLFTGSSRRSETVDDFEATHGRVGEEISEIFRWLSGV